MPAYIVGYNMVGYMPEAEPHAFEDHESAKRCLINEMLAIADAEGMAGNEDEAEELTHAAEELNLVGATDMGLGQWSEIIGNTSYWLNFDPDIDADEYNGESY